jgi:two-component system, NtrC family, nitrogen regulation sensor histidine kinase NtrY
LRYQGVALNRHSFGYIWSANHKVQFRLMLKQVQRHYIIGGAGLLFIFISIIANTWLYPFLFNIHTLSQVSEVRTSVTIKERDADIFLKKIASIPLSKLESEYTDIYNDSKVNHIRIYITRLDGGIIYFSSNSVFPSKILLLRNDSELQKLANGYYLQRNIIANGLVYIALVAVQYQYPFQNQYLQNTIPFLKDNNDYEIVKKPAEGYEVKNASGQYLFSLKPKKTPEPYNWIAYLFIAGCILFFYSVDIATASLLRKKKTLLATVLFLVFNAVILCTWKLIREPADFYRWPVFSPYYYGSSAFFSSLGDVLIFSILTFVLVRFLTKIRWKKVITSWKQKFYLFAFFIGSFIISTEIANLIHSLIIDSVISFDLGNIFSLNFYSVVGIVIIIIIIASYLLFIDLFSRLLGGYLKTEQQFYTYVLLSMIIAGSALWLTAAAFYIAFIFNAIFLNLHYHRKKFFQGSIVIFIVTNLAICALFLSIIISKYNDEGQKDDQHEIASKVITERDPIAEYMFSNIYNDLLDDEYIRDYFRYPLITGPALQTHIQQVYFSGYFSKYDIDISTFTPDSLPYKNPIQNPLSFYNSLIDKESGSELPDNLFYLHIHTGLPTYVSKVPIYENSRLLGIILIRIQQKPFYEESVYPELLVSETVRKYKQFDKYSYAVYSNGVLLNQKGEYPYPGFLNFKIDTSNFTAFKESGYTHLVHAPHANLLVIVSSKSPGLLYYLSSFAFVFLFLTTGYMIATYSPYYYRLMQILLKRKGTRLKRKFGFKMLSLRNKILITVISGMTISMLLIGIVTVSYIIYQYNKDELDRLRKKTRLITTRLSNDLQQNERQLAFKGTDLHNMVKTLSEIYQADINIFDNNGNLLTSTENTIYDKQIIAPKMDAQALLKFRTEFASQVIQEEHIGKLKFTSCYMPIRNSTGHVTEYLDLPYFSKEQELKNRISSFLEALVNLYLLLFLILVMLGLFMTRLVTAPLGIIRNHLRNTSLSGTNEFIAWNTDDEIGKLVDEYNRMILDLKESADRLAQSEREDALKELAQHVAHEIKNPLTPMKLGIQQLQNAYYSGAKDYDALFKKVTNLIVKQIDTLSAIATDFNDSAKEGFPKPVNINSLLQQVCELFSHNLSSTITTDLDKNTRLIVYADINKMTRVFTNLLNNAIQAIPENRHGLVTLRTALEEDNVIITIEDNGSGIPELLKRKIFIPKFSTKSSGTGLGLAISKAIIEQAGGSITFTSVVDKGSVFTIVVPLYHEQAPDFTTLPGNQE